MPCSGVYVSVGPKLGILLDADGGTTGLNKTNLSVDLGLGFEILDGLLFDIRYDFGVKSIIDKDFVFDFGPGITASSLEGRTRGLSVGLRYKFK